MAMGCGGCGADGRTAIAILHWQGWSPAACGHGTSHAPAELAQWLSSGQLVGRVPHQRMKAFPSDAEDCFPPEMSLHTWSIWQKCSTWRSLIRLNPSETGHPFDFCLTSRSLGETQRRQHQPAGPQCCRPGVYICVMGSPSCPSALARCGAISLWFRFSSVRRDRSVHRNFLVQVGLCYLWLRTRSGSCNAPWPLPVFRLRWFRLSVKDLVWIDLVRVVSGTVGCQLGPPVRGFLCRWQLGQGSCIAVLHV